MLFPKILYTSLFSGLLEPSNQIELSSIEESCTIKHDIIKSILYESYIPLDALVFQIGISKMSKSEVRIITKKILEAKNLIAKQPDMITNVFNTSSVTNTNSAFSHLLDFRQGLIMADKSIIFENLIKDQLQRVMDCIDGLKNRTVADPKLDKRYMEMVDRIYDGIYENMNIQEMLDKEKKEFYREYKELSNKQIKEAKIALSLGTTLVNLKDLMSFSQRLASPNKESLVREWVNVIFDAVEQLYTQIATKEFIEQKSLVEKFIEYDSETDVKAASYEIRTKVLKAMQMTAEEVDEFMNRQKRENRRILSVIQNLRKAQWVIRSNKEIKEDMANYLLSFQPEDKKKLLNHFQ